MKTATCAKCNAAIDAEKAYCDRCWARRKRHGKNEAARLARLATRKETTTT